MSTGRWTTRASSLARALEYVEGDYHDDATFAKLARVLSAHDVKEPVHYLAIPPSAFPAWCSAFTWRARSSMRA